MTAINRKHHPQCPFWSAVSMKCRICNGGLFIPLDDHTEAYCKTPHFSACQQYTLHSENQIYLQEKVRKTEENRRKYMRIEISRTINLVKLFKPGKSGSRLLSHTKTLDVSKGGMRVATENPLVHDTVVQFSFDDSFPHTLHEVTGQVEWCNKQIDEPGYQAGISFREEHVVKAMCSYLGKHT